MWGWKGGSGGGRRAGSDSDGQGVPVAAAGEVVGILDSFSSAAFATLAAPAVPPSITVSSSYLRSPTLIIFLYKVIVFS